MGNLIVSIDGTAGSGKQRIAKYIAKNYKLFHLDSGILYRRLTGKIIKNNISPNDLNSIKNLISSLHELSARNHKSLRKEYISSASSKVASIPFVRTYIDKQQKIIVKKMLQSYKGCVIDGRDIGSKVFKNANIKLYISVNNEIRAKRRHKQLIAQGEKSIYAQILKEINLRDRTDKTREHSPLKIPEGAVIVDNSSNFKVTISHIKKALKKIK
jgi:cytidylate kinase